MAQISKVQLEQSVAKKIREQLVNVIKSLSSDADVISLFNELLTPTERVMLAKRLGIAVLLVKEYSYRDIRAVLKVSFPTIRVVEFWLSHGEAYKRVVRRILEKENLSEFFQRVDRLLDIVIPIKLTGTKDVGGFKLPGA